MGSSFPPGACRICVVEVEGARTLLAACRTPASSGMIVRTNSAKVIRARKIVKITGVEDAQLNQGRLCVKGRFGYDFIYSEERLKTPLIRTDGSFREATWDEALDLVATKFKQIITENGPDALAGVSCARSISEDSCNMQKLFRSVFKTNNIDHCART